MENTEDTTAELPEEEKTKAKVGTMLPIKDKAEENKKQEEPEMKEVEKTPSKGDASKPVPTTPTNKLETLKQENGISFADNRAVENIIF